MARKFFSAVMVGALLIGCAPIKHTNQSLEPVNTQLTAGVGDTILSISKEKSLPNAFGAADIYGRTTPTGQTTVQYLGVRNGKAIFKRHSVAIETGATTMNSTPLIIPNQQTTYHSGVVGGTMYSGTSTSYAPPTIIPANTPRAQILDQGGLELTVDLRSRDKTFMVEGKTIEIRSADNKKIVYSISD